MAGGPISGPIAGARKVGDPVTEDFPDCRLQPTHRDRVVEFHLRTDMDVLALGPRVVRKARTGSEVQERSGCETLPGG